jgi:regulator of protease activity HflC (stomatin/prohibitin superfamily)
MTVQAGAVGGGTRRGDDALSAESESGQTSASLPALTVVMLDQVDSKIAATTRFRIPTDRESFLTMAHEYRTPENLLRTALVPAFKETVQATGSLMAAEEYYSGRRTEFNAEFENQMQNGIYLVSRQQVAVQDRAAQAKGSADASASTQTNFGEDTKVRWIVKKQLDSGGLPVRKKQSFTNFGITVVEARVTDLKPNSKFVERMQLKQQAAADRAIAQEKRVQEEEQKLLAIAKGDREVAEEQARIDKQTAQVTKERADIDAERIKVLAEADKYEREARIAGDNALQQKLDTELEIQKVWADAYAKRAVPQYVFGGGREGGAPVGGDTETTRFMQLMTIEAAKRLAYDRGIPAASASAQQ